MDKPTALDLAHAAMQAQGEDGQARLGFYQRLADAELTMLLEQEPQGDKISPRLFQVEGVEIALVFDRDDRLADFAKSVVPYVALSGRAVVNMFAGRAIGLGLNLDVAPSSIVIPPGAIDWLAQMLNSGVSDAREQPVAIFAPTDLPHDLRMALDAKLLQAQGLAEAAYLMRATYASGHDGHLLAIRGAASGAHPALTQAISEAVMFCDYTATTLDVAFFETGDPIWRSFENHALRFDLRAPEQPAPSAPKAPGTDPDRPPRL